MSSSTISVRLLTYNRHRRRPQDVRPRLAHVGIGFAPPGDDALLPHQLQRPHGQTNRQDVRLVAGRPRQLEQCQIVPVRLRHPEQELGVDNLQLGSVLLRRQGFGDFSRILRVQFTQVDRDVLEASLLDAVGGRGHEHPRHEDAAALVLGDPDVSLPRVLSKVGRPTADDAFLEGVLWGSSNSAFTLWIEMT